MLPNYKGLDSEVSRVLFKYKVVDVEVYWSYLVTTFCCMKVNW